MTYSVAWRSKLIIDEASDVNIGIDDNDNEVTIVTRSNPLLTSNPSNVSDNDIDMTDIDGNDIDINSIMYWYYYCRRRRAYYYW